MGNKVMRITWWMIVATIFLLLFVRLVSTSQIDDVNPNRLCEVNF